MRKRTTNIPDDPIEVLLESVKSLESAKLSYALYGGLALATYGTPRETIDVDHVVKREDIDKALRAIKDHFGYTATPFREMKYGGLFLTRLTVMDESLGGAVSVDLVSTQSEEYTNKVLERAYTGQLRGQKIRVVAPEDFIILKILSTREIDIEDAISVVVELHDNLDTAYIEEALNRIAANLPDKGPAILERYHTALHKARAILEEDLSL